MISEIIPKITNRCLSSLPDECLAEIQKPHDKVKELTGTEMTLFRPPYGDYNNTLIESANALGYHVVQWSVDSLDWKDYGADSIVDTILNHKALGDGAIILMHNGAKYTKDALERVITGLQDKGYEIVPISQLIYTENIIWTIQGANSKTNKLDFYLKMYYTIY